MTQQEQIGGARDIMASTPQANVGKPMQVGGARDLMATRAATTNAANAFDQAEAGLTALTQSTDGYTQQDYLDMGYTDDEAYYLADRMPVIAAILATSADWETIKGFASHARDITRF